MNGICKFYTITSVSVLNSDGGFCEIPINIAAGILPGQITFYYNICSNGSCTGTLTCVVQVEPTFYGNPDNITTTAGTNGFVNNYNVLTNDNYIGGCGNTTLVPATTSNVTITNVVNAAPYQIISSNGVIPNPSFTPAIGTYIMSYRICDIANSTICQTVSVRINVPTLRIRNEEINNDDFDIEQTIISPNPTSNILNIQFNKATNNEFKLEIYDVIGRTLLQTFIPLGSSHFELDLSNYANANYFIKINDIESGNSMSKKILKN